MDRQRLLWILVAAKSSGFLRVVAKSRNQRPNELAGIA